MCLLAREAFRSVLSRNRRNRAYTNCIQREKERERERLGSQYIAQWSTEVGREVYTGSVYIQVRIKMVGFISTVLSNAVMPDLLPCIGECVDQH